jgi:hypothetical protein
VARTVLISLLIAVGLGASGTASAQWLERLRGLLGGEQSPAQQEGGALTSDQISAGLREALEVGTRNVVGQLGAKDGFNLDPAVHIPLPDTLEQVRSVLERVGREGSVTELETQLNRAAEAATPQAKELFLGAIRDLTLDDVRAIFNGPDDAATEYFRSATSDQLLAQMKPLIDDSLAEVGAARTYADVLERYNALPLVPQVEGDLTEHVANLGVDGIFYYLAREEAAIRQDPVARTTDLLKSVFGNAR